MSNPSVIFISALLLFSANLSAQIITDGTLGPKTTLSGPEYTIGDNLGQQKDTNLFHSFQEFNLKSNESATFSGPDHIQNVISRVTGGNPSNIDGTIRSLLPNADFYFLNPYGIMFGPNARLDVQGSFHASTADYLRLGEGGTFHARNPSESLLTVAPIEAFGFLGQSASIKIVGSHLETPVGETLSIISGDIIIKDGTLLAESGQINLVAIGDVPELQVIPFTANELAQQVFFGQQGTITLLESNRMERMMAEAPANIDVSGSDVSDSIGGKIFIRAGQFFLNAGSVFSDTYAAGDNGLIDIAVEGEMRVTNSARITTNHYGQKGEQEQPKGGITIRTKGPLFVGFTPDEIEQFLFVQKVPPHLTIEELMRKDSFRIPFRQQFASTINTTTFNAGHGGNIEITTPALEVSYGLIESSTSGSGNAGNIHINAQNINLHDYGYINASVGYNEQVENPGTGQAGKITIRGMDKISATDILQLSNFSSLSASTAPQTKGNAGNVDLSVQNLRLEKGSEINSLSKGEGDAGAVKIIEANTVSLIGASSIFVAAEQAIGGNVMLDVNDYLYIADNSWISAESQGKNTQDSGGNVTIGNPTFLILDKGQVLAGAKQGDGGNINITANHFIYSHPFEDNPSFEDILFPKPGQRGKLESKINASSKFGQNGTVLIEAPEIDLTGTLFHLARDFSEARLSLDRCAGLTGETISKFFITIRDVLPPGPGDLMTHSLFLD